MLTYPFSPNCALRYPFRLVKNVDVLGFLAGESVINRITETKAMGEKQ